ncbi:MAG: RNA polymerase sigma factor, partial [Planctomycetota bacterium]
MSRPADDAELAQRAKDGDEGAYAALVQRQAPRVAAYLGTRIRRPEVVDTLVAETIDAGWRYLHKYRPPQSLSAWFRGLAAEVARF